MATSKPVATIGLSAVNFVAASFACYLLIAYGRVPLPLASPDELRFDFLFAVMAVLTISAVAIDLLAMTVIFLSPRKWVEKKFSAVIVLSALVVWAVIALLSMAYTG